MTRALALGGAEVLIRVSAYMDPWGATPPMDWWTLFNRARAVENFAYVVAANQDQANFRIFGPDETVSNMLDALFEVTDRQWEARTVPGDESLAPEGRVLDSMLSAHQSEGWLGGYLLTGRDGPVT